MRKTRSEQLEIAKAALHAGRDINQLMVCPGKRGADTVRNGIRRRGRHLYWYIGEFQHLPGMSGPVKCDEVPHFRTEAEAKAFLADVKTA